MAVAQADLTRHPETGPGLAMRDWSGRRVLITGYSGFVGSWLTTTLLHLGAEVHGFAANEDPHTRERATGLAALGATATVGDVRDFEAIYRTMAGSDFDGVFHLAAQPLVSAGLADPRTTLTTNIVGSIHVLEAARLTGPAALVHVTSDKCYRNRGWQWPYREVDALGAGCPYSTSKAAAELVFESYLTNPGMTEAACASVRFGNIIGGGDRAARRLVPDVMTALFNGEPVTLRHPRAVRPWQHVLDVVNGLLKTADALIAGSIESGEVFNFAPPGDGASVHALVGELMAAWGDAGERPVPLQVDEEAAFPEQELLRLDGRKAAHVLDWDHAFDLARSAAAIVDWELAVANGLKPTEAVGRQVREFVVEASASTQSSTGARK